MAAIYEHLADNRYYGKACIPDFAALAMQITLNKPKNTQFV
jgi:hypothetical protein